MDTVVQILVLAAFLLPPLAVYGLVIYVAPNLGNNRRWAFFLAACVAGVLILGLVYACKYFFGLQDVRLFALFSLVLLIIVGIDYNRRYPEKRCK
jgi:hypothetical protein